MQPDSNSNQRTWRKHPAIITIWTIALVLGIGYLWHEVSQRMSQDPSIVWRISCEIEMRCLETDWAALGSDGTTYRYSFEFHFECIASLMTVSLRTPDELEKMIKRLRCCNGGWYLHPNVHELWLVDRSESVESILVCWAQDPHSGQWRAFHVLAGGGVVARDEAPWWAQREEHEESSGS